MFDVTPYAFNLTTKLIAEPDSFTLPRKLKIAFSNSEEDTSYAAFNDVGFIANLGLSIDAEIPKQATHLKKDFRGVACPMNFVKAKIALSTLKTADILEILLDDGEPIEKLKEKLNVDFRKYTILRACNPAYAFKALQEEDKIGTMLPCNVHCTGIGQQ